jgi:hypothetical protein
MTTRVGNKISVAPLSNSKVVADHRKKKVLSTDKRVSIDSGLVSTDAGDHRNISQSAWNKIRLVELKKKERLNFHP